MLHPKKILNLEIDKDILAYLGTLIHEKEENPDIDGSRWKLGAGHPAMIRDLFLFDSLGEAACFAHCNKYFLGTFDRIVMTALGLPLRPEPLQATLNRYPNARLHTVFSADLAGVVADCKVALISSGSGGQFCFSGDKLLFTSQDATYEFDEYNFSLRKFQKLLGLPPSIQAHKPKGGHASFFQMLNSRNISGIW